MSAETAGLMHEAAAQAPAPAPAGGPHRPRRAGTPQRVAAGPIVAILLDHKRTRGLAWDDLAQALGLPNGGEVEALVQRRYLSYERARLILLALAGLPRPPTTYEQRLAEERERREILERRAARRRALRAAHRSQAERGDERANGTLAADARRHHQTGRGERVGRR